jgi:outer membrane immunogenic protein
LPPQLGRERALLSRTHEVPEGRDFGMEKNRMHKGTMRQTMLAVMGLAGATMFGGAAIAADISRPVYKAPPAGALPVSYDWTGFYVGGHVGYGWSKNAYSDPLVPFSVSSTDGNGFMGGGQAGFNYQVGQFVFGVEGDMSGSTLKGATNVLGASFNTNVDWTATLTGRAGIAFDRWLVYGKGGAAWAHDRYSTNFYTFPGTVELTDTRIGWTAGAGIEYAFAPQWSAKVEYNYMDFGTKSVSFTPGTSTDIDQQVHAVKLGVNYKFGGGPIMSRY